MVKLIAICFLKVSRADYSSGAVYVLWMMCLITLKINSYLSVLEVRASISVLSSLSFSS